jgi:hypothetical protein
MFMAEAKVGHWYTATKDLEENVVRELVDFICAPLGKKTDG